MTNQHNITDIKSPDLTTDDARAGRKTPYMKYILGISTGLAVVVLLATLIIFAS